MNLFVLDEKTKLPVPSPEALTIKCFFELWRRSRKVDGDHDGRDKMLNRMELAYVYFQEKFDSRFKLKAGKDREDAVKKLIGLDRVTVNGKPLEWEPDDLVKQCRKEFADTQVTASSDFVSSLEGTVKSLSKYLDGIQKQLEAGNVEVISPKDVKDIIGIINDAPDLMKKIEQAKLVLQNQQDALIKGRKERNVNKFELPGV